MTDDQLARVIGSSAAKASDITDAQLADMVVSRNKIWDKADQTL